MTEPPVHPRFDRSTPWEKHGSVALIRREAQCEAVTKAGKQCSRPAAYHYEAAVTSGDVCRSHLLSEYVYGFNGLPIQRFFTGKRRGRA